MALVSKFCRRRPTVWCPGDGFHAILLQGEAEWSIAWFHPSKAGFCRKAQLVEDAEFIGRNKETVQCCSLFWHNSQQSLRLIQSLLQFGAVFSYSYLLNALGMFNIAPLEPNQIGVMIDVANWFSLGKSTVQFEKFVQRLVCGNCCVAKCLTGRQEDLEI